MSTIPNYPAAAVPLDGSELVAIWQGNAQRAATIAQLLQSTVAQIDALLSSLSAPSFAAISSLWIPTGIDLIRTAGYNAEGDGGDSVYVCDTLASTLVSHARFVISTANGRKFRLVPTDGAITLDQAGAIGGSGNEQPIIQAAQNYCEAAGIKELRFTKPLYTVWATTRTSPIDTTLAADGHPLVVRKTIRWVSSTGTTIMCLVAGGLNGETHWQAVPSGSNGSVWRGGGVFLWGDTTDVGVGNYAIEYFGMDGVWLAGDRQRTSLAGTSPADPSTGDGWDLSDKAIWLQDVYMGTLDLRNGGARNMKGELLYIGGPGPKKLNLDRFDCHDTNGDAFNPGGGSSMIVTVTDCQFGNAYQPIEGFAGGGSTYNNVRCYNSNRMSLFASAYPGSYNYAEQLRDASKPPYWLEFNNLIIDNVPNVDLGSWVRGNIRMTDSTIQIGDPISCAHWQDIDLDVVAICDQVDGLTPINLFGPPTLTTVINGAPAGHYVDPLSNIDIRVSTLRTKVAEATSRKFLKAVYWSGYMLPTVRVNITDDASQNWPEAFPGVPSFPNITWDHHTDPMATTLFRPGGATFYGDIAAPATLAPWAPVHSLGSTTPGTYAITMAVAPAGGATYGYAQGQKIRIYSGDNGSKYTFAKAGAGMSLKTNRTLYANGDWIELVWNALNSRWEETAYFSTFDVLTGSAAITWPAVAAAATSAEQTITVTGADPAAPRIVELGFFGAPGATNVWRYNARISAVDSVAISVTNISATSATAPAQTILARVT